MSDDTRLWRSAQAEPGNNPNWDGPWSFEGAVGPDEPVHPAHALAWHADDEPLLISGSNYRNRLRRSAERAFQGNPASGYRRDVQ